MVIINYAKGDQVRIKSHSDTDMVGKVGLIQKVISQPACGPLAYVVLVDGVETEVGDSNLEKA